MKLCVYDEPRWVDKPCVKTERQDLHILIRGFSTDNNRQAKYYVTGGRCVVPFFLNDTKNEFLASFFFL